ncbi:MAG: hypothetical protein ABIP45_05475 [Knoellia sp.]
MSVCVAVGSGEGRFTGSGGAATRRWRRAASSAARFARGLCGRMPACFDALDEALETACGRGRWAGRTDVGAEAGAGAAVFGAALFVVALFVLAEADNSGVERRRARSPEARAAPAATEDTFCEDLATVLAGLAPFVVDVAAVVRAAGVRFEVLDGVVAAF